VSLRTTNAVLVVLLALVLPAGRLRAADGEAVDYLRDVKPILTKQCVLCHGAKKPRGGLRLDTAAEAFKGGKNGASIVPGEPDESLLIDAVTGEGAIDRMPLNRPPLTAEQVATLSAWIEQGARAPADDAPDPVPQHWAFLSPVRSEPPSVQNERWVRNPIDQFILARLERERIGPAPEADRVTLIRRLSLDLIGLPPSVAEVDAFVADDQPEAYERLVDRLLASPHYGERWGRLWLDLARYADSNGFNIDAPRSIWKYRDWVIDALNHDMPFDQFTIDQLAGDLRPDASPEQKTATGFHRNTPLNQEGGIDLEQFRVESVVDRVSTTATTWLGLTMACAQCHDHKYDPLSQREFYRLFAFFNNSDEPDIEFGSPEDLTKRDALRAQQEALETELRAYLKQLQEKQPEWEKSLSGEARNKLSAGIRVIVDIPPDDRNQAQKDALFLAFQQQDLGWKERQATLQNVARRSPEIVTTMVVQERSQLRESFVHIQGDFTRKGDRVEAGVPGVLPPLKAEKQPPNRLDLARWLVDPQNPLTARVEVNRLWQVHFGRGLVETENDFGTQGAPPSHPELLDWLATELILRGWSQKSMHRLMVTSATYRQASRVRPELATIDRDNRLLARQSRLRLDAELIRDSALAASGLLDGKIGGPSVYPPQPDGVMTLGQLRRPWRPSKSSDRYRRGLYTYFWRATPHPALMVFDAPDSTRSCTRRSRSNTPLQALTLLNDQAYFELAQGLAARVLKEAAGDADRLRVAFRLCVARTPTQAEQDRLAALLSQERADVAAIASKDLPALPPGVKSEAEPAELAAWTSLARVLMNLDEFITRE
jgi:mono/diheme cytochrome c family protein